jgi:hypothetical protein
VNGSQLLDHLTGLDVRSTTPGEIPVRSTLLYPSQYRRREIIDYRSAFCNSIVTH